jgi:hypothetical protein
MIPTLRIQALCVIIALLFALSSNASESAPLASGNSTPWHGSIQYLGLTWHPDGGVTPELYRNKFDSKAYFVLNVGLAGNLDYRLGRLFFARFSTGLYKDCAFVMAGYVHAGPRIQWSWGGNSFNFGIGPIFSFREDWHRFKQFVDDDFYGRRVKNGWQYRFFPAAMELEYLRRINDSMEFQYSLIPGAPLIVTSLVGIRFDLKKSPFK